MSWARVNWLTGSLRLLPTTGRYRSWRVARGTIRDLPIEKLQWSVVSGQWLVVSG